MFVHVQRLINEIVPDEPDLQQPMPFRKDLADSSAR